MAGRAVIRRADILVCMNPRANKSLIAAVNFGAAVVLLIAAITLLASAEEVYFRFGVIFLIVSLLTLAIAHGLWTLENWAWQRDILGRVSAQWFGASLIVGLMVPGAESLGFLAPAVA